VNGVPYGIHWRVRRESRWLDATDSDWVVEQESTPAADRFRYTRPGWDGEVIVQAAVSPRRDVLLLRWEATASLLVDRVEWRMDLAPRVHQVPEWPGAPQRVPALSGFAAFHDLAANLGVHFRPEQPGRAQWKSAELLQLHGAGWRSWSNLGDGVWIGYTTEPPPTGIGYTRPESITAPRQAALTEPATAFIETIPAHKGDMLRADLFVILTPSAGGIDELRDSARRVLLHDSIEDARNIWTQTFERSDSLDSEAVAMAMRTLRTSRSRTQGLVVDTSASSSSDALIRIRRLAFVPPALARLGFEDIAMRQLSTWISAASAGDVSGALPAAIYEHGTFASARWETVYEPAAWALWSVAETLATLPLGEASRFVNENAASVEAITDFAETCVDPVMGLPLTPLRKGESESHYALRRAALGRLALWSAARIERLAGEDPSSER